MSIVIQDYFCPRFDPRLPHFACWSVIGHDTEPQIDFSHRKGAAHRCTVVCVREWANVKNFTVKCFEWSSRLEKHIINREHLPSATTVKIPAVMLWLIGMWDYQAINKISIAHIHESYFVIGFLTVRSQSQTKVQTNTCRFIVSKNRTRKSSKKGKNTEEQKQKVQLNNRQNRNSKNRKTQGIKSQKIQYFTRYTGLKKCKIWA